MGHTKRGKRKLNARDDIIFARHGGLIDTSAPCVANRRVSLPGIVRCLTATTTERGAEKKGGTVR